VPAPFTLADRLLAVVVLLATVTSLWWARSGAAAGRQVRVEVAGRPEGCYPLGRPRQVRVRGPAGTSVIEIDAGGVRVREAPCKDGLCRQQGRIHRRGAAVVCVPNRLVLVVEGDGPPLDVDAVVR